MVAVEIDIARPHMPGMDVLLEGVDQVPLWQSFEYEHIHLFCRGCGRVGHHLTEYSFLQSSSSPAQVNSSSISRSVDVCMPTVESTPGSSILADDDKPAQLP